MAVFKCKMCGGDLEIAAGMTVAECEYCGTKQTLPKANDEVVQNLFNRANNLRIKCEFDKAEQVYEKILQENDTEAEAHWGIVLCKYGIEYVEDPKTYKRVPTCHRTSYDAVATDADYLAAIEHADPQQKSIYEAEARAIDEIQKNILNIVKNEKPFDVFICYKESDENGKRTQDSVIANDIYYQLTQEGLKVFYAAITLEDKLGQEYEPYIFAALNSAQVMLVIGTKPQYFSAVWVKNEWSRFLKLMKADRSKLLIPCYKDMDAYDLPEEFSHLQAQDMSKIGFINDVVRGIKKVSSKAEPAEPPAETTVSANAGTASFLKRAFMFLEDGDWDGANEYCEKVLDIDPECAEAYLGKLMADLCVKNQDDLKHCGKPFDGNNFYQKTLRFADARLKTKLEADIAFINARNEEARLRGIYETAVNQMAKAKAEDLLNDAAVAFESISNYKDAAELAKQCREKAEIARKDAVLAEGMAMMNGAFSVAEYNRAIDLFQTISGWKDADAQQKTCQEKIVEMEKRAARNRKNGMIATAAISVLVVFVVILCTVIIPNFKYSKAVKLMNEGKYADAVAMFEALNGFKDSAEKIVECRVDQIENAAVGDSVFFGSYEQDGDTAQKEPIEWIVLDRQDNKVLLISKYALDDQQFKKEMKDTDTWETSDLRRWLNEDFIKAAFNEQEKEKLLTETVLHEPCPDASTPKPGNDAKDKVFVLSYTELERYFPAGSSRICEPTTYVAKKSLKNRGGGCQWWLRTCGKVNDRFSNVQKNGDFNELGIRGNRSACVRPAMWIDISE